MANPGIEQLFHMVERQKEAYVNLMHVVENINLATDTLKKEFDSKIDNKQRLSGEDFGYLDVLESQARLNKKHYKESLLKVPPSAKVAPSNNANATSIPAPTTTFSGFSNSTFQPLTFTTK